VRVVRKDGIISGIRTTKFFESLDRGCVGTEEGVAKHQRSYDIERHPKLRITTKRVDRQPRKLFRHLEKFT